MKWSVAQARQRFAELLRKAQSEPQAIYSRGKLVAAICGADADEDIQKLLDQAKGSSISDAFKNLREIAASEDYKLMLPKRRDRRNPFEDSGT